MQTPQPNETVATPLAPEQKEQDRPKPERERRGRARGGTARGAGCTEARRKPQRDVPARPVMAAHVATAASLNRLGLRCKAAGRYDEGRAHASAPSRCSPASPLPTSALSRPSTTTWAVSSTPEALTPLPSRSPAGVWRCGQARTPPIQTTSRPISRRWPPYSTGRGGTMRRKGCTGRRCASSSVARANRAWDVAVTLGNLGAQYAQRGRLEQAVGLLRRAAELKTRTLGSDHPDVAVTLNNLALALRRRGKFGEAAALYGEAVELLERSLGANHPKAIACRANAARCAVRGDPLRQNLHA